MEPTRRGLMLVLSSPSGAGKTTLARRLIEAEPGVVPSISKVVDFLDFHVYGWHWPAFNVADSAITIGAGLLIYESLLHRGTNGERRR